MGGFRVSTTSSVIAAACLLAYQNSAHAVSQQLRNRKLDITDYEYVGCFKDSRANRVFEDDHLMTDEASSEFCADWCNTRFVGVQHANECWCSDSVDLDYGRHGEDEDGCDMACAGDPNELCGGVDAFSLYTTENPGPSPSTNDDESNSPSTDYKYAGCFKDNRVDRVFEDVVLTTDEASSEFCTDWCNTIYVGVQHANECWCSDYIDLPYWRHGEDEDGCDMACAGDPNELCGGVDAFSLYTTENPGPIPSTGDDDSSSSDSTDFLLDDITERLDVVGIPNPGGKRWADSYSIDGVCYMQTTFDHEIGGFVVDTPVGEMTVSTLYDTLKEILGEFPSSEGRPLYNDVQCGHGPANTHGDEEPCPGLVEYGREGCKQIGPKWDLSPLLG